MNALLSYSKEIQPNIRKLLEKKDALNEWKKEDEHVQDCLREIKELQENLKAHVEDKESVLVREIADLEIDIKLAIKAAVKGTNYKAPDLKDYLFARAKESVAKVIDKGDLFAELDKELA